MGTWPGRAVLIGGSVKLASLLGRNIVGAVRWLEVVGSLGTLALLVGLAYFLVRLISLARQHLLWRVRRKLILSYILVGLVPALLIITFGLVSGLMLFGSVSQYIVTTRVRTAVEQAQFLARTCAIELARLSSDADVTAFLERKQIALATRYPGASLAMVPVGRTCPAAEAPARRLAAAPVAADQRRPMAAPRAAAPDSRLGDLRRLCRPGAYDVPRAGRRRTRRRNWPFARRCLPTARRRALPSCSTCRSTSPRPPGCARRPASSCATSRPPTRGRNRPAPARGWWSWPRAARRSSRRLQPSWVAMLDFADWETGRTGQATLSIGMSIGEIYNRLSPARLGEMSFGQLLIIVLIVVGLLFLFIQFVALIFGLALARSITGSIHELFVGTVQVQKGDFSHKIEVKARDQLGELANSFNTMTSRLTSLLAEMAEKKRLEEELRIARDIQMSLLPQGPLRMAGLQMTAHCSPAREVGGDYYDFFAIDEQRVGILIADVSGKGTSAALYMAELKGLMLSLTQIHTSPRELMVAANRIIADNLDARSFITMTYAVLDMRARTMTYARAGHTPLIHLTGHGLSRRAQDPDSRRHGAGLEVRPRREVCRVPGRGDAAADLRRPVRAVHRRDQRSDERGRGPVWREPA